MILEILVGAGLVVWLNVKSEERRQRLYLKAIDLRMQTGKPILNIGCGQDVKYIGDINIDIQPSILPNFTRASIYDIPYPDKFFSVAYAFHVLEHLEDPLQALEELSRIADFVLVETPLVTSPSAWLEPSHKWVMGQDKLISINPVFNWIVLGSIGLLLLEKERE